MASSQHIALFMMALSDLSIRIYKVIYPQEALSSVIFNAQC